MMDIQLNYTQRYYHFIAFEGSKEIIKKSFFNEWSVKEQSRAKLKNSCVIYHYSIKVVSTYFRGDFNNPNRAIIDPNISDFLIIDYPLLNIVVLGFPFRRQTVDLVKSLINDHSILSKSNFIKVDMNSLIKANNKHTDLFHNENHFWLGGVFINITGDSFLSTVKLTGDKPLDSDIYRNYFKEKLNRKDKKSGVERCILKSKVGITNDDTEYQVSSSIHIDKFGNYKLYLQTKARNLLSIPSTFDFLSSLDCLTSTPRNPVEFIENDDK